MKVHSLLTLALGLWLVLAPAAGGQHDPHGGHEHTKDDGHDEHAGDVHDQEAEHDTHEGHGHAEETAGVTMAPEVVKEFGIDVEQAAAGVIEQVVRLPGEVVYNADRIAHVTPTVAGTVREVNFSVGDCVRAGQVMAVLNSRELAEARSAYLAAKARLGLARENLERDRRLFQEKVGTERAVIESRQAFEEAEIRVNQAESALRALGYSHDQVLEVAALDDSDFNAYKLTAPIGGIVTQRHLTLGEVIEPTGENLPFVVADLASVWVNLTVYQRDLSHVTPDQSVDIEFGHGIPPATGAIEFVSPALDEATRTAYARVVLNNPEGHWRPGLFVTGRIERGHEAAGVVVPRAAVAEVDGETVVFVKTDNGFQRRSVHLGRTTEEQAEIVRGLAPGERYAARNVLVLKAEMNRAALEHAGHAH
jgi:cobalt-zinc-cadmium efflux system membrane fusion protein